MKIIQKVSVNDFVRRQTPESGKTFTNGISFEKIAQHAQSQLGSGNFKMGYRDGVILVPVDNLLIHHFICPFVRITTETKLNAVVVKRRPEETPYIQIRALNGTPLKTGSVDLILYRHDVLAETNEQTSDADWELISFHAIPEGVENMPMGPVTMMRNQLQLSGGTKAHYESKEWAKSVKFWQEYAMLEPNITID
ncbi:MAG: DUF3228 family protein [Candidatus Marinimicrobia bacterium]|nr:DUF3228 family protein [Candidatus Neomarinimicrobiota bacterium]